MEKPQLDSEEIEMLLYGNRHSQNDPKNTLSTYASQEESVAPTRPAGTVGSSDSMDPIDRMIDAARAGEALRTIPQQAPFVARKPLRDRAEVTSFRIRNHEKGKRLKARIAGRNQQQFTSLGRGIISTQRYVRLKNAALSLQRLFEIAAVHRGQNGNRMPVEVAELNSRFGGKAVFSVTSNPNKPIRIHLEQVSFYERLARPHTGQLTLYIEPIPAGAGQVAWHWLLWMSYQFDEPALKILASLS